MQIGEAAKRSGLNAKMIRHYEAIGLLPAGARGTNDYRNYGDSEVHELHFIRRARDLGFSLAEIGQLLSLWRDKGVAVQTPARSHSAISQTWSTASMRCALSPKPCKRWFRLALAMRGPAA